MQQPLQEIYNHQNDEQTPAPIDVSIIVPCFRSAEWLPQLVTRIEDSLIGKHDYEILLINDASPDSTWNVICELSRTRQHVAGPNLLFNAGQFCATLCGFANARGKLVVTMDDDLQNPPEEIPRLIHALTSTPSADCVIGAYRSKSHSRMRNLGSRMIGFCNQHFYGKPPNLRLTSFRVMHRRIAKAICAHSTNKPIIGPLLLQCTSRIINIEVEHSPRFSGRSGYQLSRLIRMTFDNLISATTLPLKLISLLGLLSSASSTALGAFYLY
ncbi:MAG: glycosyltransferase, partial [Planctomycetaceae bacterium]|nr:glycosyltransferase [Planctomycetaceae bacterium]